ncbi:MAG: CDP-glycerol glycerophosphotransferase family protein, partial [Thermobifida fusca]|nr:CDP-glycerol glycerophosphotransferase family protein [Thermobifida fusca]
RPRRRTAVRPLFDLAAFAREFGDQYVLLVRSHYLERLVVPPSAAEAVIDVSAEHDTTPLLAAADALITDYSSVMFDYVLLDRPMIYYVPDYDDYVHHARGTYFSLAEVAPGPLAFTEEELFAALRELDTADTQYVKARRAFAERFAAYDTGTAARAIVDRFFLQEGRR